MLVLTIRNLGWTADSEMTHKNHTKIFLTIKEMINSIIDDEESKKGFLALVRQSYLLGKLRTNIVSIFIL